MEFLRTLLDALKLALFVRPARPARRIGPGQYWLALLLVTAIMVAGDWTTVDAPRRFDASALGGIAFYALLAMFVAYGAARVLQRPAIFWPLVVMLLVLQNGIAMAARVVMDVLPEPPALPLSATYLLWCAWLLLAVRRTLDWLEPYRRWTVRTGAALAITFLLVLPPWWVYVDDLFYTAFEDAPNAMAGTGAPPFEPEVVMAEQYERVDAALAALAPQRPGRVDLYLVAFAGDGSEAVFGNEVRYARQLFEQRFDGAGRVLVLANDPKTTGTVPLATLANLRRTLAGIGARIDPREDIVAVFLTSHGSEDHELYVSLDPLPLAQVTPDALATAFADAKIDWRVAIVSACYSGGFVDALSGEHSLVLTAARSDRTSFGCGSDSDITYFGRAFLVHGLNRRDTLIDAFDYAKREIARREEDEGKTPSEPQLASSAAIEAQLDRWRKDIVLGTRVPFRHGDGASGTAGR
ncbi:MAG TPA: C13 family peptidase [Xanthomonadales bacterium]|nr:C13 family peptidase [Xanthomonadales bacterium]